MRSEGVTGNDGEVFSGVPPSRRIPVLGSNPTLLHSQPIDPLLHHLTPPRMSFRPMLKQVCPIAHVKNRVSTMQLACQWRANSMIAGCGSNRSQPPRRRPSVVPQRDCFRGGASPGNMGSICSILTYLLEANLADMRRPAQSSANPSTMTSRPISRNPPSPQPQYPTRFHCPHRNLPPPRPPQQTS